MGLAACALATAPTLHAANYYLQANMPAGTTWNNLGAWYSQPTGGDNPDTMHGNDFNLNGHVMRADHGTFSGASLANSVAGGTVTIQQSGIGLNVLRINAQTNIIENAANRTFSFSVGSLELNDSLNVRPGGGGTLSLNLTTLSGSGTLLVGGGSGGSSPSATSTLVLSVDDAANFSGALRPTVGTLSFGANVNLSAATLILDSSSIFSINLSYNATFAQVVGENFGSFTSLASGSYTATELNSLLGSSVFLGDGTLTVIPEAGTMYLLPTLLLGGLCLRQYRASGAHRR